MFHSKLISFNFKCSYKNCAAPRKPVVKTPTKDKKNDQKMDNNSEKEKFTSKSDKNGGTVLTKDKTKDDKKSSKSKKCAGDTKEPDDSLADDQKPDDKSNKDKKTDKGKVKPLL